MVTVEGTLAIRCIDGASGGTVGVREREGGGEEEDK